MAGPRVMARSEEYEELCPADAEEGEGREQREARQAGVQMEEPNEE